MPIDNHKPIAKRANDPPPFILWSKAKLPVPPISLQLPLFQSIGLILPVLKWGQNFLKAKPPAPIVILFKKITLNALVSLSSGNH